MRYFGGKARISAEISLFLTQHNNMPIYFEPFCGACWVASKIKYPIMILNDSNKALITLWHYLQKGWYPPKYLSKETYTDLQHNKDVLNPLTAFAGFGCSFAGKWFAGYASTPNRNYALNAYNSLMKKIDNIKFASFFSFDYNYWLNIENALIYCDPPYRGTTEYGAVKHFDSDLFWNTVRYWHYRGNKVFVSEYSAPKDFICVKQINTRTDIRCKETSNMPRTEKLFTL